MRQKIKEFLYEQLNDEKGLTAALIIQTLNKDQEKVRYCYKLVFPNQGFGGWKGHKGPIHD